MSRRQTFQVRLSQAERDHLKNLVSVGEEKARKLTRARILLKADDGWTDDRIAEVLDVGRATVGRVRTSYATDGFDAALNRKLPDREYERKIDGKTEAHLVALLCGEPPAGRVRWTLRLLAEQLVLLEQVEIVSVSHESVRQTLKKTSLSLGRASNG